MIEQKSFGKSIVNINLVKLKSFCTRQTKININLEYERATEIQNGFSRTASEIVFSSIGKKQFMSIMLMMISHQFLFIIIILSCFLFDFFFQSCRRFCFMWTSTFFGRSSNQIEIWLYHFSCSIFYMKKIQANGF